MHESSDWSIIYYPNELENHALWKDVLNHSDVRGIKGEMFDPVSPLSVV